MDEITKYAEVLAREHPGVENREFAALVLDSVRGGDITEAFIRECEAAENCSRSGNVRSLAGMVLQRFRNGAGSQRAPTDPPRSAS